MLPDDLLLAFHSMKGKSDHQIRVEEFMRLAAQTVPFKPVVPPRETRYLRAKIIFEEALETIAGLGFDVVIPRGSRTVMKDCYELSSDGHTPPDLIEIVDGCADLRVVTTGTLSACGVPDKLVQFEVDQNNLAKFGPGGYRRESDGKWMKPPGHKPPRVKEIIAHHLGA